MTYDTIYCESLTTYHKVNNLIQQFCILMRNNKNVFLMN